MAHLAGDPSPLPGARRELRTRLDRVGAFAFPAGIAEWKASSAPGAIGFLLLTGG